MKNKLFANLVLTSICCIIIYFVFRNGIPIIYKWDTFGNYIYLPMLFDKQQLVFHNLDYFELLNKQYQVSDTLYQFVTFENGSVMTKYTAGWAVLMLPFYLIAELWASLGGYETNGFTFPYQCMMTFGGLFYCVSSMFLLKKLLLRFFDLKLSIILVICLVFGTNFFFLQYANLGSTHFLEFFLVICLLLQSFRFYENINLKNGIILGIIIGLISIVRVPDILFALIPIFWKNEQFPNFKTKITYFFKEKKAILFLTVFAMFAICFIQLYYWKKTSGHWFIDSYANNPGEGFDFLSPYIYQVLFSFRKGWLIYTPIMLFAVIGFYFWIKKHPNQRNFMIAYLLFFYVISSWTTWWYAGSFSQRAQIDAYPILVISMGFCFQCFQSMKLKIIPISIVVLLIVLNLFQSFQMDKGILNDSRMTKAYYFSVFGQTKAPNEEQLKLLSVDRYKIYLEGGKIDSSFRLKKTIQKSFDPLAILNKDSIYTPLIELKPNEMSNKPYFWIQAKWTYLGNIKTLEGKIFSANAMYHGKSYAWMGKDISNSELDFDTLTKTVTFRYLTPHFRTTKDVVRIGVWAQSGDEVKFTKVNISIYEPKIVYE